jgi:hypothetical protein
MSKLTPPQGMLVLLALTLGVFIAADRIDVLIRKKEEQEKAYQQIAD